MRNLRLQLIVGLIIVCYGTSLALACAFIFPWQLLDNREKTLDKMPVEERSFAWAEAHVVPPPKDKLIAVENEDSDEPEAVTHAEVTGLSSDQAEVVRQMRLETTGDSAFNRGAMLPASVRLYTAGAVDFHEGDSAKAIRRFQAIFDLPASERRDREVWAAFMLGRLYGRKGKIAEASRSFALTRELANNGAPDPLGLGVASFGEEARLHLKRAQALQKAGPMSSRQRRKNDHEIVAAVRLYAEQAAHGSTIGIDSLRDVIDEVLGYDSDVAICDPIVQQLLVTRTLDADAWPESDRTQSNSQISGLVRSVQKCGSGNLIAADRLAAIAYRDGDYPLAHTLAVQTNTPLAMWVQARMAMQKGDVGDAAKFYAAASKAFPPSGDTSEADQRAKALLDGESGVLMLSRGEYIDALEQLYPYAPTFWGDVAYIAERVLTIDELKTFVDTHKNTQFNSAVSLDNLALIPDEPTASTPGDRENDNNPADWLPNLLARRLVRAGRYHEALKYFPPPAVGTSTPFEDYAQALDHANIDKSNVDRARGWYRAATLAGDFKSGNKIMGTEGPWDNYREPRLSFSGIGQVELRADDPFVTDGERQRFKASVAKPNLRYHYLFVGVDEAIHAADLLPPRSQAFAAVLCNATSWIADGTNCDVSASDLRRLPPGSEMPIVTSVHTANLRQTGYEPTREKLTCQLYQRYLKEGAVVPWAWDFGQVCPEPDFASAVQFVQAQAIHDARRHSQIVHHRWIVLIKLALVALCLGASTWWFLRNRYV